jgi:hypothetical protein
VAQALLRLIGKPILFINREPLQFIKKVTGSPVIPGAGTFILEKLRDISGSIAEYRLKSYRSKLHEATWKQLFNILDLEINNNRLNTNANEILFYESITTKKLFKIYNNYGWPSMVRNKANYIPGYAYCLIEKQIKGKSKRLIKRWDKCNEQSMIKNLNSAVNYCIATDDNGFVGQVSLLHDIAQSLFVLLRELYFEVINRRHLDLRMELKRKEFIKTMELSANDEYYFGRTI